MSLRQIHRRAEGEKGFTLIELLVVILIIGILAAIAIPSFLNQKKKGQDSVAKSDLENGQIAMETCGTQNTAGSYALCDLPALKVIEPTLTGSKITVVTPGVSTWTITAHSDSGADFTLTRATTGIVTGP